MKALKQAPLTILVQLLFLVLVVLPLLYTLFIAFFQNPQLTEDIRHFDSATLALLFRSLLLAASVALLATLSGSLLAFVLYKATMRNRRLYLLLILLPLFISPYILAVAWKDLFFTLFGNSSLVYSYFGVMLVLTTVFTPLAVLITGTALARVNSSMEESALMVVSRGKMIRRVIFPLIKPALFSAFILIFIFSISNFAVPAFFGVRVFTTEIFTQFSAFYNHSFAILQSLLLVLICVALLFSERRYLADAPFFSMGGKGLSRKYYAIGWGKFVLLFWLFLSIVLPMGILIWQSLSGGMDMLKKAWLLLSPTIADSVLLALASAFLILLLAFIWAYGQRQSGRNSFWPALMLLLVFTLPSTVFGISLIKFYNRPELNWIYGSYAIILIAYLGKFTFISERLISNALRQIPDSLTEAALIQGIPEKRILVRIVLPLLLPALSTAFMISFILSLGELGTSIMIYPPGTELMPIKVFTIMANAPQSLTASMNLLVFSVTLVSVALLAFVGGLLYKKYDYGTR